LALAWLQFVTIKVGSSTAWGSCWGEWKHKALLSVENRVIDSQGFSFGGCSSR
jgi:hypothetical protein